MISVVSDASVALKWFVSDREEGVADARALLDARRAGLVDLVALDLTLYEVGNALLRGHAKRTPDQVSEVLAALEVLTRVVGTSAAQLRSAAALAGEHGLTLYDASYAAFAAESGALLATCEKEILRAGLGKCPGEILAEL